jgi:foldase protein PrsA
MGCDCSQCSRRRDVSVDEQGVAAAFARNGAAARHGRGRRIAVNAKRIGLGIMSVLVSAAMCVGMTACGSGQTTTSYEDMSATNIEDTSGGVAATVNGTEIGENAVTAFIRDLRSVSGLEDDSSWADYLSQSGITADTLRTEIIQYYEELVAARQLAEQQGVTVDQAQIDEQVDAMKSSFGDDETFQSALAQQGMTEDLYRIQVELSLLTDAILTDDEKTISDDMLLSYITQYASQYNGAKRSSHILFSSDDEATAQEVLDKINSGELDFATAAQQYSTDTGSASDGGDVGWDKLTSFVTEYQDALDQLSVGQVSGLVTSQYGIHIIKCTDQVTIDENATSLDQISSDFVQAVRDDIEPSYENQVFVQKLQDYLSTVEVTENDMPEGLPYDVDVSTTSDATTSDSTTSSDQTTSDATTSTETDSSSEATDNGYVTSALSQ